jgi:hypothetical protein
MFRNRHRQQLVIDVLAATLTKEVPKIRVHLDMIHSLLKQMEKTMTQEVDALNEVKAKLVDLHEDVIARLNVAAGELSAEGKAEISSITDAITAFDAEIGDADGSDTPPQPVDGAPVV